MNKMISSELINAAIEHPNRLWVRFMDGDSFTYGEFTDKVNTIAKNFLLLGLEPEDRLVTLVDNKYEFLATWFAGHLAGIVVVPLNTALKGDSLAHMIYESVPKAIVIQEDFMVRISSILDGLTPRPIVIVIGQSSGKDIPFIKLEESPNESVSDWSAFPFNTAPNIAQLCCIMYTSGTTGPSKGACYCNGFHMQMGIVGRDNMQYGPNDILYTCLPLFHGNALNTSVMPALVARAGLVIGTRFSASRFWREAASSGATATNLLGAMTPILLRSHPSEDELKHSITRALVIPAPPEYHDLLPQRFGLKPIEAYGLSDGAMVLWCPPDKDAPRGSCGLPTSGYEVAIVDENDEQIIGAGVGELVFRITNPWTMALGYWKHPEATAEAWRNLWFHTGDSMRRDENGWYFFVDRLKDVIRRRGENISAFEVESAVRAMAEIVDCAAYALPSDLTEDDVAIAVVVTENSTLTEIDIINYLKSRLPYFAVPRYIRFIHELPMTQTQKIRKQALRDDGPLVAWDREAAGVEVNRFD